MWAEVLNLAQIGVHDRFFDLGGDSLAATQCLAKIAQEFGAEQFTREISLYVPTLAGMAKALSDPAEWMGHGNEVLPLRSNGGGLEATNWNAGVRKTAHRFQELAADPNGILVPALRHYQPKPWSGRTIHVGSGSPQGRPS